MFREMDPNQILQLLQRMLGGGGAQMGGSPIMQNKPATVAQPVGQSGGDQGIMGILQQLMGRQGGGAQGQAPASRATWGMGMRSPSMNRIF